MEYPSYTDNEMGALFFVDCSDFTFGIPSSNEFSGQSPNTSVSLTNEDIIDYYATWSPGTDWSKQEIQLSDPWKRSASGNVFMGSGQISHVNTLTDLEKELSRVARELELLRKKMDQLRFQLMHEATMEHDSTQNAASAHGEQPRPTGYEWNSDFAPQHMMGG